MQRSLDLGRGKAVEAVLDELSAEHDDVEISVRIREDVDIRDGIAVDDDQIRVLARFDRPARRLLAGQLRPVERRPAQHVRRRDPVIVT